MHTLVTTKTKTVTWTKKILPFCYLFSDGILETIINLMDTICSLFLFFEDKKFLCIFCFLIYFVGRAHIWRTCCVSSWFQFIEKVKLAKVQLDSNGSSWVWIQDVLGRVRCSIKCVWLEILHNKVLKYCNKFWWIKIK